METRRSSRCRISVWTCTKGKCSACSATTAYAHTQYTQTHQCTHMHTHTPMHAYLHTHKCTYIHKRTRTYARRLASRQRSTYSLACMKRPLAMYAKHNTHTHTHMHTHM